MKKDPSVPNPPVPDPVDRLLRQTLAGVRPGDDAHVDAERLAAWSARTLPAAEAQVIELHLSTCAACRDVLAVFVRVEPVPAPAATWWHRWRMAWVVPATAAAAATLAWVAWPGPGPAPAPPASAKLAQAEPQQRVVVAPEPSIGFGQPAAPPAERAEAPKAEMPALADARKTAPSPAATAPPTDPQGRTSQLGQTGQQGQAGQQGQTGQQSQTGARMQSTVVAATPPPPPPVILPPPPATAPPPPAVTSATPPAAPPAAAKPAPAQLAESIQPAVIYTFSSADPREPMPDVVGGVANRAAGGGGGGGRGGGRGGAAGGAAGGVAMQSRDMAPTVVRWRVHASGIVERSTDDGTTWTQVALNLDPSARVTTGVAPSPGVCWLAGRAGLVLRSADGTSFERVKFPESVDLSSIRATDARTASVTTTDGRVFVTADGGATWRRP